MLSERQNADQRSDVLAFGHKKWLFDGNNSGQLQKPKITTWSVAGSSFHEISLLLLSLTAVAELFKRRLPMIID